MSDIGGVQTKKKADGMNDDIVFQSSFLQSASYNPADLSLAVNFKSGSRIVYQQVKPAEWEAWKLHPSKGQYYSRAIKGVKQGVNVNRPLMVSDFKKAKEGKTVWHNLAKRS